MTLPPARHVEDLVFDAIYPEAIRAVSRRFWTPVDVARRAARMLRLAGAQSVLDVGSGVGKFVLVAASVVPEMRFVGLERRPHLVEIAQRAQQELNLANAELVVGDATSSSWSGFDGFYFFNPFAEHLFGADERLDDSVDLGERRFFEDVARTEHLLRVARLGAAVVTYHGMSGRMPACYELSQSVRAGSDWLRLWVKTKEEAEGFYIEYDDGVALHRPDGQLA